MTKGNLSRMNNLPSPRLFVRLLLTLCLTNIPILAIAVTHDVVVSSNRFTPNDLTIEVGDTVRWTNSGFLHDVTSDVSNGDNSFASPTSANFVFSKTFLSVEEIFYHCSVHSSPGRDINTNMNGRINVVEGSASTDVSIESVDSANGSFKAGGDISVNTQLKNNGAAESGVFDVNYYLSVDDSITTTDTLIGTKQINNIAADTSVALDEVINLPDSLAAGDYFIGAILNISDSNPENDTNLDQTSIFVFTQFIMNAGLNDAWFNPLTNGQGFMVTVFADLGLVSVAWFTYDTELPPQDATANLGDPGHRWMSALGVINNDESVMNIEITSGGIFDESSDIQRTNPPGSDGTLMLKFDNCNSGSIDYDITSIGAQGVIPIQRVAGDNIALCDALLKMSQQ